MKFIDVTGLDSSGSGLQFPSSVNVERIVSVVDYPEHPSRIEGCQAFIVFENAKEPMYTTESREDIMDLIAVE